MLLKRAKGKWKIETKRILNPSPISKFVANSLFCSHFSFSCSAFLLFVASNCVSQFFFVVPARLRRETSKWAWRFMGVVNTQSRIDSLTVDKIQRVESGSQLRLIKRTRMYFKIGCRCLWPWSCVNSALWTTLRLRRLCDSSERKFVRYLTWRSTSSNHVCLSFKRSVFSLWL